MATLEQHKIVILNLMRSINRDVIDVDTSIRLNQRESCSSKNAVLDSIQSLNNVMTLEELFELELDSQISGLHIKESDIDHALQEVFSDEELTELATRDHSRQIRVSKSQYSFLGLTKDEDFDLQI
jgi:hypothetical protein